MSDSAYNAVATYESFLDKHYHYLVRSVRVDRFYSWLRSRRVFTQCDEEEVDYRPTSQLRTGHLIDIVKTKGRHGFEAFMEVLEYGYEHVFTEIYPARPPRTPPADWSPVRPSPLDPTDPTKFSTASAIIQGKMVDLLKDFSQDMTKKKAEISQLHEMIINLQKERDTFQQKQDKIEDTKWKLEQSVQKLRQHELEILELQKECSKVKAEKDEIRKVKDKHMAEVRDLQEENSALSQKLGKVKGEITFERKQSLKYKPAQVEVTRLKEENHQLQIEIDKCKSNRASSSENERNWILEELPKLRDRLSNSDKVYERALAEKDALETRLKDCESLATKLQETNHQYLSQVREIMQEKDQEVEIRTNCEKKVSILQKENDQLRAENKEYVDKMEGLEEHINTVQRSRVKPVSLLPYPLTIRDRNGICKQLSPHPRTNQNESLDSFDCFSSFSYHYSPPASDSDDPDYEDINSITTSQQESGPGHATLTRSDGIRRQNTREKLQSDEHLSSSSSNQSSDRTSS